MLFFVEHGIGLIIGCCIVIISFIYVVTSFYSTKSFQYTLNKSASATQNAKQSKRRRKRSQNKGKSTRKRRRNRSIRSPLCRKIESALERARNGDVVDLFIDFEKCDELKLHKESQPLSIQRIIEFAQQRVGYNKVIELDYDEIEKDLQYQYKKYNGDNTKLRKLYFDFDHRSRSNAFNNLFYFSEHHLYDLTKGTEYDGIMNYTLVHYLLNQMVFGDLIPDDPALILMKLLIKNKIVDCNDIICCVIWDGGLRTVFSMILYGAIQSERQNVIAQNVQHFVELLILIHHNPAREEDDNEYEPCIVAISHKEGRSTNFEIDDRTESLSHRLLCDWVGWMNFSYCPDESNLDNTSQIIERLLFRTVLPFNCTIDRGYYDRKYKYIADYEYLNIFVDTIKAQQHLFGLFDKFKICENIKDTEKVVNRRPFPKNQMALASPLVILPHFNRAKKWMKDILIGCDISKEITGIICDYLYVDYDIFYSKEVQHNLNVKSMVFLTHLAHFGMDQQFVNDFYQIYNNAPFISYLVDNYLRTLSSVFSEYSLIDCDIIISLIQTYNDNNDKFPLDEEECGIYFILQMLLGNPLFYTFYESFIKLLRFVKKCYKDEFNINYNYQLYYDNGDRHRYDRYDKSNPTKHTLINMLCKPWPSSSFVIELIKFILTEFVNENHKFALSEESNGIYSILQWLVQNDSFDACYESFIGLLRVIKRLYKDEFNINHIYQLSCIRYGFGYRQPMKDSNTTLITMLLAMSSSSNAIKVIKFILTEFKNEYDMNNPCFLDSVLSLKPFKKRSVQSRYRENVKFMYYELIKFLVINYNDLLDDVCNEMQKKRRKSKKNKEFLKDVNKCRLQLLGENN